MSYFMCADHLVPFTFFETQVGYIRLLWNSCNHNFFRSGLHNLFCHLCQLSRCPPFLIRRSCQDTCLCHIGNNYIRITDQSNHLSAHFFRIGRICLTVISHHRVDHSHCILVSKILDKLTDDPNLFC